MSYSGMLRRVALIGTYFSEERIASIIRGTGIIKLATTLAATTNRSTLLYVPPKRGCLKEPHGVTAQKVSFFKYTPNTHRKVFTIADRVTYIG
jgi:hypothetical protein